MSTVDKSGSSFQIKFLIADVKELASFARRMGAWDDSALSIG
jgi:hypothetical protein